LADAYFQRAIAADPNFAPGRGALSYVNLQRAFIDEPKDRPARLEKALRQGRHAVALDELDCFCHCALGRVLCVTHQNDEALAALDVSWSSIQALRRPVSRRDLTCSGTGARSKRRHCSIAPPCSVRATAIFPVSTMSVPGRISPLASMTLRQSSPGGQHASPMSRIRPLRRLRLRSAIWATGRRPKQWPSNCCNGGRTTAPRPRGRRPLVDTQRLFRRRLN
jgi:hypothetical protein